MSSKKRIVISSLYSHNCNDRNNLDNNSDSDTEISIDYPINEDEENNDEPQNRTIDLTFDGESSLHMLRTILKGSKLEHLGQMNELQDSAYYKWEDVVKQLRKNYNDQDNHNANNQDWEIVCKVLRGETGTDFSQMMVKGAILLHRSFVKGLYAETGYEFYSIFYDWFVKDSIPPIIQDCGLDKIYEQLVFYEYIYSNRSYTLYHKLRWMVDFGYFQLIELIDNHYLENVEYASKYEDDTVDDYTILCTEYLLEDRNDKLDGLYTLLRLHSGLLPFDPEEVTDSKAFEYESVIDGSLSWDEYSLNNNVENAVGLGKLYRYSMQNNRNEVIVFGIVNNPNFKSVVQAATKAMTSDTPLRTYAKYCIIDTVMRMIEDGFELQTVLGENLVLNVVYRWFVNASNILKSCNVRNATLKETVITTHLLKIYSRDITLSEILIALLKKTNMDFGSMTYIYYKDRSDIFDIVCESCKFDTIDSAIIEYYPMSIINSIIIKTGETFETFTNRIRGNIELDLYKLCAIHPSRAERLIDTVIRFRHSSIEIPSLLKRYEERGHISYEYLITLYELSTLNKLSDLQRIASTLFLESYPIKEAYPIFSRYDNSTILASMIYGFFGGENRFGVVDNYVNYLVKHSEFDRIAPELGEIWIHMKWIKTHDKYRKAIESLVELRNSAILKIANSNVMPSDAIDLRDYEIGMNSYMANYDSDDEESDEELDNDTDDLNSVYSDDSNNMDSDEYIMRR